MYQSCKLSPAAILDHITKTVTLFQYLISSAISTFFPCSPRTAHHRGLLIQSSASLSIFNIRSLTSKYSTMQKSRSVRCNIINAIGLMLGNNACYISLSGFLSWVTRVLCHPWITPNKNIKTNCSSCIPHHIHSVSNTIVRSRVLCPTKALLSIACSDKTSAKHKDYTQQHE